MHMNNDNLLLAIAIAALATLFYALAQLV